jgi:hypothetical protein
MNTPTNYMNAKKRVIFRVSNTSFYAVTNGKKTMNPKAVYLKNTGKKVANLASVPSPIRPARVAKKPASKGSKMMAKIRGNIKKTYKPTSNMNRVVVTPRVSPPKKNKPNLSNAVARMKASAAKLKANRVSTKFVS